MPKSVLSLSSIARVESELHPGVVYVTRKMTDKRRIELNLRQAPFQARVDEVIREIQALGPDPFLGRENDDLTEEQQAQRKEWFDASTPLIERYAQLLDDHILPTQLAWGLAKVTGLQVEDDNGNLVEVTGANAAELLPPDMYVEAVEAVRATAGLGAAREGNSESPTTSNAAVAGETPSTTA